MFSQYEHHNFGWWICIYCTGLDPTLTFASLASFTSFMLPFMPYREQTNASAHFLSGRRSGLKFVFLEVVTSMRKNLSQRLWATVSPLLITRLLFRFSFAKLDTFSWWAVAFFPHLVHIPFETLWAVRDQR